MSASPEPPQAKRVDHVREHHGDVFVDPYEWLRDKSNPEVIDYLNAENSYTEELTDDLAPLRQTDFRRNQGPHQGDGPLGADATRRLVVLRP